MTETMDERFWEAPENISTVKQLVKQLRTPIGVVPFIGAGISIPYDYPGWTSFLRLLAEQAGLVEKIELRIQNQQYEEAAEDLETELGRFYFNNIIRDTYGDEPTLSKLEIKPAQYLPLLSSGPVITTNFDHILENIFRQCKSEFQAVVWGAKADLIRQALGENARYLLKLHGDALDQTDRILTFSEYKKHYGDITENSIAQVEPDRPLPYLLYRIMSNRRLLFIGCSLVNDRTINILKALANKPAALDHYAILPKPSTEVELRNKRKVYGDIFRIRPIWLPITSDGRGFEKLAPFLDYLVQEAHPQGHPIKELKRAVDNADWVSAATLLEKIDITYPFAKHSHALALIVRGKQEIKEYNLDAAARDFSQALEMDSMNPEPYYLRGSVYLMRSQWRDASNDFKTCIELNSVYPQVHTIYGMALMLDENPNYEEVEEQFKLAIKINTEDRTAAECLTLIYALQEEFGKLKTVLKQLEKMEGDDDWKPSEHFAEAASGQWWKRLLATGMAKLSLEVIKWNIREFVHEMVLSKNDLEPPSGKGIPGP